MDIYRELETFDYKCEAFIKMTRVLEEMEPLLRNLRLIQRLKGF
jgi:hypothetical protein